jgi:hypothetical protein
MDPIAALALAESALRFADVLVNAVIATRSAAAVADIQATAARMTALKQASDALSAKVHAELQALAAKAG